MRISFAIVLLLTSTLLANPTTPADPARELVKRLAAPDYHEREQASRELLALGRKAYPALEDGTRADDPEVRARCRRLLPMILDLELKARLEAFIADPDGKGQHELPGWARWQTLLGRDRASRDLFAAVVRANSRLMHEIENQATERGLEAISIRCTEMLQQISGRMPNTANRADVAQLLFLGTNPDLQFTPTTCAQINQFLYRQEVRGWFTEGETAPLMRKLLLTWLSRHIDEPNTGYMIANLMNTLQLEELTDLGLQIVLQQKAPAHVRANVLIAFGRHRRKEVVPRLQAIIDDDTLVGRFNINRIQQTTHLGDVALAMSIHLSGLKPADFGFNGVTGAPNAIYSYYRLGFEKDEQRAAARQRWEAEWKKLRVAKP